MTDAPRYIWNHEPTPSWDKGKVQLIGEAPRGVFEARFSRYGAGDGLPGEWWRISEGEATLGYAWLDVVWGEAEVALVVRPASRRRGLGAFILQGLEREAAARGLNYIYNTVQPTHPDGAAVTAWLLGHGFVAAEDGCLRKRVQGGQS